MSQTQEPTGFDGYPLLEPFRGLSYGEIITGRVHAQWNQEAANAFYRWHQSRENVAEINLHRATGCADLGIPALSHLLQVISKANGIFLPDSPAAVFVPVRGHKIEVKAGADLTAIGWAVTFDVGLLFGRKLLQANRHLEYSVQMTKRKIKDAFEGLPVIKGFRGNVHCYPPRIVHSVFNDEIEGKGRGNALCEAFAFWKSQV